MADENKTLKTPENRPTERLQQQRRSETSDTQGEGWISTSAAQEHGVAERATKQAAQAGGEQLRSAGGAVAEAARRSGRIESENLQEIGEATGETVQYSSEAMANAQHRFMEETATRIEEIGRRMADAVQSTTEDMRLWFSFPPAARTNAHDFQQGIQSFVDGLLRTNLQAARQIMQVWDPSGIFDLNRRLYRDYMSAFMQGSAGITRAMHRAADEGLRPIEEQLRRRAQQTQQKGNGQQQHHHHHHHQEGHENQQPVAELMERNVRVAKPDDTVQQAARLMREEDTGILPVGEGDRLIGMVTDRDVTVRLVAEGRDPAQTKVRDVMTPDVMYVFEDEPVSKVAQNMADQQVRRMPVVNRNKRLVGVVSVGDLARHGRHQETSRAYTGVAA